MATTLALGPPDHDNDGLLGLIPYWQSLSSLWNTAPMLSLSHWVQAAARGAVVTPTASIEGSSLYMLLLMGFAFGFEAS